MDPNACLARIVRAAVENDPAELREAADDLAGWLESGGFAPVGDVLTFTVR